MHAKLTVTLPPPIINELKEIKLETGTPVSTLVRELLTDNVDVLREYAQRLAPPTQVDVGPMLSLKRPKDKMKGPLMKSEEKIIREVFDEIPLYTEHLHWDAYHNPDRYTIRALSRKIKVKYYTLHAWIMRRDSKRLGWFWKGWIILGNTRNSKKQAIFKTKTTEEILKDLHENYLELHPPRSREDFEEAIRWSLKTRGPSTLSELYNQLVLENPNVSSNSKYTDRYAFIQIIRGLDGVVKTGKKRVKSTLGYYYTPIYAAEECAANEGH